MELRYHEGHSKRKNFPYVARLPPAVKRAADATLAGQGWHPDIEP
jgi:hypothetical protein